MAIAISAVINTCNEESNIEGCLACIKDHVDEIVISDMHSTDRTVEICRRYTDRIGFQQKRDFVGSIREEGVARARNDWIFVIDCDERVHAELFPKLREVAARGKEEIVCLHRRNFFCGLDLSDRGWGPEVVERFFRKGSLRFLDHPHRWAEKLGPAVTLPPNLRYSISHDAHPRIRTFIAKMNAYTDAEAVLMNQLGWRPDFRVVVLRPLRIFLRHYIRLKGYRAGMAGLSYSSLMGVYWFIAALKLSEAMWRASTNKAA